MDSRESLPVIMALGVRAEIRIDRDRERNEMSVFAEPVLKCRVVEYVLSRFFASQVRCRAKERVWCASCDNACPDQKSRKGAYTSLRGLLKPHVGGCKSEKEKESRRSNVNPHPTQPLSSTGT